MSLNGAPQLTKLSDEDLVRLLEDTKHLSPPQQREVLRLIERRDKLVNLQDARDSFLPFVRAVWPVFIPGHHHTIMAEAFEKVARGEITRLIINMPPRFTKSELTSWLLPAWFLGKYPQKKIIQASNTAELAAGFGRRVRNLVSGLGEEAEEEGGIPMYQQIFPNVRLAADSQAAASWHTNKKGEYFAIGVNGKVTGKGADIFIIDDPHSEQEAKQAAFRPEVFDDVYEWYTSGPRQRLQPGAAIIIVMTRWSKRDLTGRVLQKQMARRKDEYGDEWTVIELPAIVDEHGPTERSMWPAFWPLPTLRATRGELETPKWKAQYQQEPTSEEGALIKRKDWRIWGANQPDTEARPPSPSVAQAWYRDQIPTCKFVLQSWDTANTKTTRADFSACTTWGIFETEDPETGKPVDNAILIDGFKRRMEFPELKRVAKRAFLDWEPDSILIEYKGSGIQLVQEFLAMQLPVDKNTGSSRGTARVSNDKVARANLVSDIFSSGRVWAPATKWAEDIMEECAEFPNGEHDDYVDSVVQAMLRLRTGGFLTTTLDVIDDEDDTPVRQKEYY